MVGRFLPLLMSLMVDSALDGLAPKLPQEERNMQLGDEQMQEAFIDTIAASPIAFSLAWYFLLHVVKQKDRYTGLDLEITYEGEGEQSCRFLVGRDGHAPHEIFDSGDLSQMLFLI